MKSRITIAIEDSLNICVEQLEALNRHLISNSYSIDVFVRLCEQLATIQTIYAIQALRKEVEPHIKPLGYDDTAIPPSPPSFAVSRGIA